MGEKGEAPGKTTYKKGKKMTPHTEKECKKTQTV